MHENIRPMRGTRSNVGIPLDCQLLHDPKSLQDLQSGLSPVACSLVALSQALFVLKSTCIRCPEEQDIQVIE